MYTVDSLDKRLIKLLRIDARQSSDVLAKQLDVSPATVRRRIRRLIEEDVMRIQAVLDPSKVGLPLTAVIAFDVDHDKLQSVMDYLEDRPEVTWFASCTGRFDIMAVVRFSSTDDLSEFVQKELVRLDGVRNTETFVCLHVARPRFTAAS